MIAFGDGSNGYQARLTFAMARHAAVDLALVFSTQPMKPNPERLTDESLAQLRASLADAGLKLRDSAEATQAIIELRGLYEPVVNALADHLLFAIPGFLPSAPPVDNWQTSPWMPRSPGLVSLPGVRVGDSHFD